MYPYNAPMHFLILSSKGRGAGCILRARGIARGLARHGHTVQVLPPFPTLPFWLDMALDGIWYFLAGLFVRSDVAVGIKPYPTLVPALLWQKAVHGAKVVLDVDDLDYAYGTGRFLEFHKALQLPWPRRADRVTYHNPHLKGPLKSVFGVKEERLVPLPQGVVTERFRPFKPGPRDLPRSARAFLGASRPDPLLVYTAHLNQACGLAEILESLAVLKRHLPRVGLLVAGGGPDLSHLRSVARQRGVEDRVRFTGLLKQEQVAACLNLADLVLVYYGISAANKHRASMKLREALACRAQVVATHVGEIHHFARHVHLSSPDPHSFARAVRRALKGPRKPPLPAEALKRLNWGDCVRSLERKVRPV